MVAAAIAGAAVAGAGASVYASDKAASTQKKAAQQGTDTQLQMFNQTQSNLTPFMQGGKTAFDTLGTRLNDLTQPIKMDRATLMQTPGYQFNLQQGLKATQNAVAARGLGLSGAGIKAAANFATGLADNTYQNQFVNAVTNQTNAFNRLLETSSLGENAAAGLGNNAQATATSIGQNIIGGANASAASTIAGANALSNGLNGLTNAAIIGSYRQDSPFSYSRLYGPRN